MNPIKLKIGVIIEKNNKILLIKEKYWEGSIHKWNMVTGSWEETDGDVKNTAVREAKEEVGLDVEVKKLFRITFVQYPEKNKLQFFYVAEARSDLVCLPSKETQDKLKESIIDYKWFERDEILQVPDAEFVSDTVINVLKSYILQPENTPVDVIKYLKSERIF